MIQLLNFKMANIQLFKLNDKLQSVQTWEIPFSFRYSTRVLLLSIEMEEWSYVFVGLV